VRQKIPLLETRRQGRPILGCMVFEFHTMGLPAILDHAGADFIIYDMEATPLSLDRLAPLLAAARGTRPTQLVRVPLLRKEYISRCLDIGADGVMVPMLETAAEAEALIEAAKYPPQGRRGAAFGLAHDGYAARPRTADIRASANADVFLIAQLESAEGVRNAQSIAALDGIDAIWIGGNDLRNDLEAHGQTSEADFDAAFDHVVAAARDAGKPVGTMARDAEACQRFLDRGCDMMALGSDVHLFHDAVHGNLQALRS
jgi:2-keto-3-deoxy-L-rhamnonate aldolase RhmA